MNKLSKRLEVVAGYVDNNDKGVIDVGCDHGFLSIYLANRYKNLNVIASDINENALNSAKNNINACNLNDRIDIRLGSGVEVLNSSDNVNTVIISGMGANTIVGILKYSSKRLVNIDKIIIQSNTDLYFLRSNVVKMGYYIEDENLVKDKGIIYTVIEFKRGRRRYNYKQLYLGPVLILKGGELFREKNNKEITTFRLILKNITKGHYLYRYKIKKNIKVLESMM